jgi:hypothetical protein
LCTDPLIGYLCLFKLPGLAQARVEVPGRALFLAAARLEWSGGRGSFVACALARCRGEAWLKKGLPEPRSSVARPG